MSDVDAKSWDHISVQKSSAENEPVSNTNHRLDNKMVCGFLSKTIFRKLQMIDNWKRLLILWRRLKKMEGEKENENMLKSEYRGKYVSSH